MNEAHISLNLVFLLFATFSHNYANFLLNSFISWLEWTSGSDSTTVNKAGIPLGFDQII